MNDEDADYEDQIVEQSESFRRDRSSSFSSDIAHSEEEDKLVLEFLNNWSDEAVDSDDFSNLISPLSTFSSKCSRTWKSVLDPFVRALSSVVMPLYEVDRVLDAMARGDFSERLLQDSENPLQVGPLYEIQNNINVILEHLSVTQSEMRRVAIEGGNECRPSTQTILVSTMDISDKRRIQGQWKEFLQNINSIEKKYIFPFQSE